KRSGGTPREETTRWRLPVVVHDPVEVRVAVVEDPADRAGRAHVEPGSANDREMTGGGGPRVDSRRLDVAVRQMERERVLVRTADGADIRAVLAADGAARDVGVVVESAREEHHFRVSGSR